MEEENVEFSVKSLVTQEDEDESVTSSNRAMSMFDAEQLKQFNAP